MADAGESQSTMTAEGEKRPTDAVENGSERKRKRKSRWGGEDEKVILPGVVTSLPSSLTKEQQDTYLLHVRLEEVNKNLKADDLGIPADPAKRSPSPPPVYDQHGKRVNTREQRTRRKLEEERHTLIQKLVTLNPQYRPPQDYKPANRRCQDRVEIPQEQHPDINFIGILIGPRGNTLKKMESDTGAKIMIRGKGSVKAGKGRRDGMPIPGEDEPMHALITGPDEETVAKAVKHVSEIIRTSVENPDLMNEIKAVQLRELAALNGTLREDMNPSCNNCGSTDHRYWQCPEKKNVTHSITCHICGGAGHIARDCQQRTSGAAGGAAQQPAKGMDSEYLSFMKELGENVEEAPAAEAAATHTPAADATPASDPSAAAPAPWAHGMAAMGMPPAAAAWGYPPAWPAGMAAPGMAGAAPWMAMPGMAYPGMMPQAMPWMAQAAPAAAWGAAPAAPQSADSAPPPPPPSS